MTRHSSQQIFRKQTAQQTIDGLECMLLLVPMGKTHLFSVNTTIIQFVLNCTFGPHSFRINVENIKSTVDIIGLWAVDTEESYLTGVHSNRSHSYELHQHKYQ